MGGGCDWRRIITFVRVVGVASRRQMTTTAPPYNAQLPVAAAAAGARGQIWSISYWLPRATTSVPSDRRSATESDVDTRRPATEWRHGDNIVRRMLPINSVTSRQQMDGIKRSCGPSVSLSVCFMSLSQKRTKQNTNREPNAGSRTHWSVWS